jgi:acetyl-CoA carboxylase biotin carboxyl carrier protein
MDLKKLRAFIDLAKDSGVAELSYENKDEKYAVSFALGVKTPVAYASPLAPTSATALPLENNSSETKAKKESDAQNGLLEIVSPFVGTFYKASSPTAEPYIKIGDRIAPGKVLCIIEAMKIMNEIESDITGEIVEICVGNENYVEYGQVLFKVKPS